ALAGSVQSTAVDIEWCAQAFAVLIGDANLRRSYGANGQARAREVFDWKNIIPQYEALWNELSEKRRATPPVKAVPDNWAAAHPGFPNPWRMFGGFPTTHILPTDILHIAMDEGEVDTILKHEMNYFVPALLLPREQIKELADVIRRARAVRVQDLLAPFPLDRHDILWRCVGWMLKHGVCRHERPA
ncbi:MAG: hypothetical protein KGI97_06640, partial [Alphaproteobacteria bacterium]|nr:hypothetical protein [Alphaproteobacteria bacterium]